MQKDLLYCAIDVSKDRLDIDGAALALPEQLFCQGPGQSQNRSAGQKGHRGFAQAFQPQATPAPDPVVRELTELLQRR